MFLNPIDESIRVNVPVRFKSQNHVRQPLRRPCGRPSPRAAACTWMPSRLQIKLPNTFFHVNMCQCPSVTPETRTEKEEKCIVRRVAKTARRGPPRISYIIDGSSHHAPSASAATVNFDAHAPSSWHRLLGRPHAAAQDTRPATLRSDADAPRVGPQSGLFPAVPLRTPGQRLRITKVVLFPAKCRSPIKQLRFFHLARYLDNNRWTPQSVFDSLLVMRMQSRSAAPPRHPKIVSHAYPPPASTAPSTRSQLRRRHALCPARVFAFTNTLAT
jgi:hypothetical protein